MSLFLSPKVLFIASGLVAVLGAGGVYTAYTGLTDEEAKVDALKKKARDEKDVQAELAKTGTDVVGLRAKLKHLEEGVPPFAYIPSMAKELELAGKSHGIEVLGVRPVADPSAKKDDKTGEKKTSRAYEELTIQVKGRGSYASISNFVRSLTTFPKIVAVRMLTLTPKTNSEDAYAAPKIDADIEIRAYAFKDTSPAATALPVTGGVSDFGAGSKEGHPLSPKSPAKSSSPRFGVPEDSLSGPKAKKPNTPKSAPAKGAPQSEHSYAEATRPQPTRLTSPGPNPSAPSRGDRHGS